MLSPAPIFFHIGLPKTGTTTIQHVARKDPRIHVVGTRYFNRFEYWDNPVGFIDPEKVNLITEENQILQMPDFGKLSLFLGRIKKFAPHAHIILTIREQRDLLESRYKYQFDWHGGYTKSFDAWLRSGQGMDYLSICMYNDLYDSIRAFFPSEQIHFLLFEDLKTNFESFFKSLYDILGISVREELLPNPITKNKSLSESELSLIKRINSFKMFRGDNQMAKIEFAAYLKLAWLMVGKKIKKSDEFRWNNVTGHEAIEADMLFQNSSLVQKGILDQASLEKYNYLH
jgi:Sulfotransferase domain